MEMTFLYKVAQGTCPKSYGVNFSQLGGIPYLIIEMDSKIST